MRRRRPERLASVNRRASILLTIRRSGTKLASIRTLNANFAFLFSVDFFYPYGGTVTDETIARLRAHDRNISRYRRLLKTNLSDLERRFLEQRLSEERSAVESLAYPAHTRPAEHGQSV